MLDIQGKPQLGFNDQVTEVKLQLISLDHPESGIYIATTI
jgi:hypothetical protein